MKNAGINDQFYNEESEGNLLINLTQKFAKCWNDLSLELYNG
jgi:hypothetical protein